MDSEVEEEIKDEISLEDIQFIEERNTEHNCFITKYGDSKVEKENKECFVNTKLPSNCCHNDQFAQSYVRKCIGCKQKINTGYYLSWELMDFCSELCISKIQTLGSKCVNCSRLIRLTTFGKHYVRTRNNFRLFCTKVCLEHYKSVVKTCCCCHEDISENYLVRADPTGTRSFFCSQLCFDTFNCVIKNILPTVPPGSICCVCKQNNSITVVLKHDGISNFFCTRRCFIAYSFVNLGADIEKCITCHTYFNGGLRDSQTAFFDNIRLTFCSNSCQNIYTSLHSKLISCIWCKNKRNNFGMIRKYSNSTSFQNIELCSLNCLNLYEVCVLNKKSKSLKTKKTDNVNIVPGNTYAQLQTSNVSSNQNLVTGHLNVSINENVPSLDNMIHDSNSSSVERPQQRNVATMCFIPKAEKGNLIRPSVRNKTIQTEKQVSSKNLLPIPLPIHVPTPMAMYSIPVINAVPIPIPIPIPIFVPIAQSSGVKLLEEIQQKMPGNPFESDILKIADAIADDDLKQLVTENEKSNISDLNKSGNLQEINISEVKNDCEETSNLTSEHKLAQYECNLPNSIINTPSTNYANVGGQKRGSKFIAEDNADYKKKSIYENSQKLYSKMSNKINLNYMLGIKAWEQWVTRKNIFLKKLHPTKMFNIDMLDMLPNELNDALCLFIKEFKKPNESEYAPDTIFYLCLGIQFYLSLNGRTDSIFFDHSYNGFIEGLDHLACKFCALYSSSQIPFIVTRVEEEHLWESKQLGCHSPQVLLNTLIFFNTKYYHWNSVQQHMSISFFSVLKVQKRGTNSKYLKLRFYPKATDNEVTYGGEQHETKNNPLRCPVKIYEFYLSKCPESVKTNYGLFYLEPEKYCVSDSPVWYTTNPLPTNTLSRMINRIKMVKEINIALNDYN